MNRHEIMVRLRASDWEEVRAIFGGKNYHEILGDVIYLYPHETVENEKLAMAIYYELQKDEK